MRAVLLSLFALGVFAMPAVADDKKDPKSPADLESYDERITVRKWDGKKFLNPIKDQPAYRGEISGKMVIYTKPTAGNVKTPKGSEIIDKDGNVFVVESTRESPDYWINYVKPKDKGK
jgi:hypothetical protein